MRQRKERPREKNKEDDLEFVWVEWGWVAEPAPPVASCWCRAELLNRSCLPRLTQLNRAFAARHLRCDGHRPIPEIYALDACGLRTIAIVRRQLPRVSAFRPNPWDPCRGAGKSVGDGNVEGSCGVVGAVCLRLYFARESLMTCRMT